MAHDTRPLLTVLQAVIERTYGMERLIPDAGKYLIGDAGLNSFYREESTAPGNADLDTEGIGPRLLLRHHGHAVRVAVYYPDAMVRLLEDHDPRSGLDDRNIDAFASLVEELDHLLVVASRAARMRPVSLLELELHAGVTKYLVVMHFLGRLTRRRRVTGFLRTWARHHLFGKYPAGGDERDLRYRDAARLALRYVTWLDGLDPAARRAALIDFDRRGLSEQVGFIERVA